MKFNGHVLLSRYFFYLNEVANSVNQTTYLRGILANYGLMNLV